MDGRQLEKSACVLFCVLWLVEVYVYTGGMQVVGETMCIWE